MVSSREATACEETTVGTDGYEACFEENAVPIRDASERVAIEALKELQPDVGPQCRRALRRARLTLSGETVGNFSGVDEDLKGAETECRRESKG